jgi:UDP-glucose 4-epimerase
MKRVLVTGGCGFVGANLVRHLESQSIAVSVLDNLTTGNRSDLAETNATVIEGDIRDRAAVREAVSSADAVVHLAAHTRVVESVKDPTENFDVNARGTLVILDECRRAGVEKVALASTGGAIIGDVTPPVHENMVPRPLSPYGASKLCAEAYCSAFGGSYGMSIVALRFANVYGPFSYHKGSVVAKFFKDYLEGTPWTVFGDGTQTRDFVYVGDVCHAIHKALDAEIDGFDVFNLGSGTETTVNKLIDQMQETVGSGKREVVYEDLRAGEIYRNYTLIDKAKQGLGYNPSMTLSEGLRETWRWFQEAVASDSMHVGSGDH